MRFTYYLKNYLKFEKKEIRDILVTAFCLGFILSFKNWGGAYFDIGVGLKNLIGMFLVALFCMLVAIFVQKLIAIKIGYKAKYKMWILGLLIGVYICFISDGDWYLLLPGGMIISTLELHRIAKHRKMLRLRDKSLILFFGPFTFIVLAYLFRAFFIAGATNLLVERAIILNMALAIYTILPIPQLEALVPRLHFKETANLNGFEIFYWSKTVYIFSLLFIIVLASMLFWTNIISALFVAAILAAIMALIYFYFRRLR
jgi:hypothetical protein